MNRRRGLSVLNSRFPAGPRDGIQLLRMNRSLRWPMLLTASCYILALGAWVFQFSWLPPVRAYWMAVIFLIGVLSGVSLLVRPGAAAARLYTLSGILFSISILFPRAAFVNVLNLGILFHLCVVLPDEGEFLRRFRRLTPAHYVLAVLLALAGRDPDWARFLHLTGFLYAGVACLGVLTFNAKRINDSHFRRRALIFSFGLIAWTMLNFIQLIMEPWREGPQFGRALEPAGLTILMISLFVGVAGFELFDFNLRLVRNSLIYGLTAFLLAGVFYPLLGATGFIAAQLFSVNVTIGVMATLFILLGVFFLPLARHVTREIDTLFFPEKIELLELQRTLIPHVTSCKTLADAARRLVDLLQKRLELKNASLLVTDETREFFRLRAFRGRFGNRREAPDIVLLRSQMENLLNHEVISRFRAGYDEALFEMMDADYVLPVIHNREPIGLLALGRVESGARFDRADLDNLRDITQEIGVLVESTRQTELAARDPLTELPRRHVFEERLELELARSRRRFEPFSIGMADIDNFKQLNDTWGHGVGDTVLRAVAHSISRNLRRIDLVARYGGEEFVLFLSGAGGSGARTVGESLRARVENLAFEDLGSMAPRVSVSIGLYTLRPEDLNDSSSVLIDRADRALYEAKRSGKNCVVAYSQIQRAKPI